MRQLPIVELGGTKYYVDEKLGQIRAVDNPHKFRLFVSAQYKCTYQDGVKISTPCYWDEETATAFNIWDPKKEVLQESVVTDDDELTKKDGVTFLKRDT